MQIDLSGKTAVVTGSTRGIGHAIARALAGAGAHVILNGRSEAALEVAIAELRREQPQSDVGGVVADLSSAEGCAQLIAAQPNADILINNAGMYYHEDFFEISDASWQSMWELNFLAGVRLSRGYLPGMVKQGWGRVIFIASECGLQIPVEMIHYGVSKTGNLALSRGLAKRVAGTGVTVNAILPGPTLTERIAEQLAADPAYEGLTTEQRSAAIVHAQRPGSLIGRLATVDEVASLVLYVASTQASATTGAALRVDGGVVDSIT